MRIYDNGLLLVRFTILAFFVASVVLPTALGQTFVRRKCPSVKTETTHGRLLRVGIHLIIQMTNLQFTTKLSCTMYNWQTVLQSGVIRSVLFVVVKNRIVHRRMEEKQCISSLMSNNLRAMR